MKLALAFREPNVARLQRRITTEQFEEWRAFDRVCPFGDDWFRTARLAAAIVEQLTKGPVNPMDYLPPRAQPPDEPQSAEEQEQVLDNLELIYGGRK